MKSHLGNTKLQLLLFVVLLHHALLRVSAASLLLYQIYFCFLPSPNSSHLSLSLPCRTCSAAAVSGDGLEESEVVHVETRG